GEKRGIESGMLKSAIESAAHCPDSRKRRHDFRSSYKKALTWVPNRLSGLGYGCLSSRSDFILM
ncbi:MAG: hypothetical protein ACM3MB_10805, partial [Acidobacteriota bacterium]